MVSIRKAKQNNFTLRRKGRHRKAYDAETVGLVVAGLCIGFLTMFLYSVAFSESGTGEFQGMPESLRKTKKHPMLMEETEDADAEISGGEDPKLPIKHMRPMDNEKNAIALDILGTIDCEKLLKEAEDNLKSYRDGWSGGLNPDDQVVRRRLQQHADDGGFADLRDPDEGKLQNQQDKSKREDDFLSSPEEQLGENGNEIDFGGFGNTLDLSAKHLFCLAASENPPEAVKNEIKCDASNKKRRTLLELWSAARSQMQEDLLLKVLGLARESTQSISGTLYNVWAPRDDEGLTYMVNTLDSNSDKNVDEGGLTGLALGPGKIFVDVGSCLGMTCLVINKKYPGTKIVSLEPASPNWLLQELNLRCNIPHNEFKKMRIILGGVGANTEEEDNTMAKLMWKPSSTTSTRSWTPSSEFEEDDIELIVRLRKLRSILAEADVIPPAQIDVLNMDCQGCEYNMIPPMSDEEFEQIPTVMGNVHWGYINPTKLPSSKRGNITHKRLCQHENIARGTKECCAFLDMPVKSSVPGEVLQKHDSKEFPPRESTVSDVISDGLCDDFSTWKKEHYLDDVTNDFNWVELSSKA